MRIDPTIQSLCVSIGLILALVGCGGSEGGGPAPGNFAAHCSDGVRNFQETDVDCGGVCGGCGSDATCWIDGDCVSAACGEAATCVVATCANGQQDGGEDGVDCGLSCGACLDEGCGDDTDCATGYCAGGRCAVPTCADGVANGRESDLDCGGGDCVACGTGGVCVVDPQCATEICTDGICRDPSCTDGRLNQDETAVDCGGICPGCSVGQVCGGDPDCASLRCDGGFCGCTDERFVGAACDQCADARFMPPSCNNCADPRFTGDACDQCANPRLTGSECGECVDPRFTGAECTACADPQFGGAECSQCVPGTHLCGNRCEPDDAVETCGTSCSPCPTPENGVASCNGTSCEVACASGYHGCGIACVSDTSLDSCGTGCEPCTPPPNATSTCDGQACGFYCDNGTHLCDGLCVDRASPTACGPDCSICAGPASGNGLAVCDPSESCRVACNPGAIGLLCEPPSANPALTWSAYSTVLAARRLTDGRTIVVSQGTQTYGIYTRAADSDSWTEFRGPELPANSPKRAAIDANGRIAVVYLAGSPGPLNVDLVVGEDVTTLVPPSIPGSAFTSLSHGFIENVFFGRDGRLHVIGANGTPGHARWRASTGWETVALPIDGLPYGIRDFHALADGTFAALLPPTDDVPGVRLLSWSFGSAVTTSHVGVNTPTVSLSMDDQGNAHVLALAPVPSEGPQTLELYTRPNDSNTWTATTVGTGSNLTLFGVELASDGWSQAVVRGVLDQGGDGLWHLQRADGVWSWTALSTEATTGTNSYRGFFYLDDTGRPLVLNGGNVYETETP
ncbi:MAG: hypothetical protein ACI9MR_004105 [Myxococcota bacterium]|jgi:hypothetical protein